MYDLIYADPPWKYNSRANHKTKFRGGADGHYDLMTTEEICNLKIPSNKNSILFLWATFPMIQDAFKVIDAWGFKYKTVGFLWAKENGNKKIIKMYEEIDRILQIPEEKPYDKKIKDTMLETYCNKPKNWTINEFNFASYFFGVGYYTKSNPEVCLLATKGKTLKPAVNNISNLIISPKRKHSQKPYEAYYKLESMYPNLNKLELFAREKRNGWDSWGNEIESNLLLEV